jgi:cell wall-associated NlpC family hydrolase
MTTPAQFIAAARTYIGVKWQHAGRTRAGVDCVGLLLCAAADSGLHHEAVPPNYARGSHGFDLFPIKLGTPIQLASIQDGDLLIFADGRYPCHMGVRSTKDGIPHVVHAPIVRRKVVEEPLSLVADSLRRAFRPVFTD